MALSTTLEDLREDTLITVMQTSRRLEGLGIEVFHSLSLHPAQFNLLNLLAQAGGRLEQADLLDQVVANAASITVVLARLARRGLIESHSLPGDRRRREIQLTPAGRRTWEKARKHYEEAIRSVFGGIEKKQLAEMKQLLKKLSDRADRNRREAQQRRR